MIKTLSLFPICMIILIAACTGDKLLHRDFTIKEPELKKIVSSLPEAMQKKILSRPQRFLERIKDILDIEQDFLFPVDRNNKLDPNYKPNDLVNLKDNSINVTKSSLSVRKIIIDNLIALINKAKGENIDLTIGSAFRTYSYQKQVYAYWVNIYGQKEADRKSAKPGHSEHQLGTTIDFHPIGDDFIKTPASSWLLKNAKSFGFSLSYPEGKEDITGYIYEPWHYRYIGKETIHVVQEYFSGIHQIFLVFFNENSSFFRESLVKKNLS